jgi:hypothetical protein
MPSPFRAPLAGKDMSTYYELFDFRSGNVMEHFAQERDAWDALRQMAMEFGIEKLHDIGLSYTHDDEPVLIAMDDDLVQRVAHELNLEALASESRR